MFDGIKCLNFDIGDSSQTSDFLWIDRVMAQRNRILMEKIREEITFKDDCSGASSDKMKNNEVIFSCSLNPRSGNSLHMVNCIV
jgi:hypothetical protein